jgi:hypothetical protein
MNKVTFSQKFIFHYAPFVYFEQCINVPKLEETFSRKM